MAVNASCRPALAYPRVLPTICLPSHRVLPVRLSTAVTIPNPLTSPIPPAHSFTYGAEAHYDVVMTDDAARPILVSQQALRHIAGLRLPGAQLATLLALLAHLDHTGHARITQPELCRLLGTGPGRVWQSLQALVDSGLVEPPDRRPGIGRATPYRIPSTVAIASATVQPLG